MAKQTINIGASPNDGTGTPLRTAFDYTNQNFTELYTAVGPSGNNIVCPGSATITGDLTVDANVLKVDTTLNRVGIGTASPVATLQSAGTFTISGGSAASSANGLHQYFDTGTNTAYISAFHSGVDNRDLRYDAKSHVWQLPAGTAMTLNSTGLGVGVVPSAGKGALQLSSGINFPSTQVASSDANTLDDYEEGTFTPTISGSTVAGVGTYSNQIGRYTKIGNQVTVWIRISWSAHTGTGDMRISDLPFTIANVNNLGPCAAIGYSANINLSANNYLMLFGNPGTTRIDFWQTPTGGGSTATVSMDSSADIGITMTYFV